MSFSSKNPTSHACLNTPLPINFASCPTYAETPLQNGAIGLIKSAIALENPAGLVELVTAVHGYSQENFRDDDDGTYLSLLKEEALRLLNEAESSGAIIYRSTSKNVVTETLYRIRSFLNTDIARPLKRVLH